MPISMTEGLSSYKAAVEAPQWQQQAKDRSTILSMEAEASKEKMAAYKQEQALSLQARAIKSSIAQQNSDVKLSDTKGALRLNELAIEQSRSQPELQSRFQEERQGLLKQQGEEMDRNLKAREEVRAARYDALSSAFANPTSAEELSASGDPALKHFGDMLLDKKPIVQFRDQSGRPKLYSQLNVDEKAIFEDQALSGVAPKNEANAFAKYMKDRIEWARLDEQRRKNELDAAAKAQGNALKQQKITSTEKKDEDKLAGQRARANRQKDVDIKKIEDAQAAILAAEGLTSPTDSKEVFGMKYKELSATGKATYDTLEQQKKQVLATWEENVATLGGKERKSAKEEGYTKTSPAKPTSKADFAALPSGAWFVNPADGKLLQKK